MAFAYLEDGSKIHYVSSGHGKKTLLLIHGNLANTLWWKKALDCTPENYTVYALDLPGSGLSPETGKRHTIEYLSTIIEGFVKVLFLKNINIVGHSMGGGVAQLFTLNNKHLVNKLVLLNSMAADGFHVLFNNGEDRLCSLMENEDLFHMAMKNIAPMCTDEDLLRKASNLGFKSSKQVFLEQPVTMHEANWFDRLKELTCPVLYLYGDMDNLVPKEGCIRTAQALPNCEFKELQNCGHCPMVEVPDVFLWEIYNFFDNDFDQMHTYFPNNFSTSSLTENS